MEFLSRVLSSNDLHINHVNQVRPNENKRYSVLNQWTEQFIVHKTNRNKGIAVILCLFLICTGTMEK